MFSHLSRQECRFCTYTPEDMIILVLFTSLDELSYNRVTARFSELEEIGIIHDLRACIPIRWQNMF